jgi:hypothetical protein
MFDWLLKRSSKDPEEGRGFNQTKSESNQSFSCDGQAELEKTEQDLIQIRDTLSQILPSMSGTVAHLKAELDEASAKNLLLQGQLEQIKMQQATGADAQPNFKPTISKRESGDVEERDKLSQQLQVNIKEIEDLRSENQILLSGLFEVQEELEQQILNQQGFEQVKVELDGRFARLIQRYSNYVDYGELKITAVDGMALMPEIAWEMTDVFFAGMAFERIEFKTILNEGKLGIWVKSITKPNEKPISFKNTATLFPELVKVDVGQQKLFRQCQTSHWRAFGAVAAAIELSIKTQWRNVTLLPEFDTQFWGASLQSLPRDFARMPKALRFEKAKLKQELVNPDYEHLWIELFDVSFGGMYLPKFEFRLGAAQVDPNQFSTYPKLEIPLIDGKRKPFESWFEESFDDFGGKFELRFDIDKRVFDIGVWSKLSRDDSFFVYELFTVIPLVLIRISKTNQKTIRPIQAWFGLLNQASAVMDAYLTDKKSSSQGDDTVAEKLESKQAAKTAEPQSEQLKAVESNNVLSDPGSKAANEGKSSKPSSSRKNKNRMKN